MKKLFLSVALIGGALLSATAKPEATAWASDKSHSNVSFTVTHMMVTEVEGKFKNFEGTIAATKEDFSDAQFNFTADVNSINTDDEKRDGHLKSDDFFNAEKFPQMKFKSISFKKLEGKKYILEGELTIRDVTKKVKFDVTYNGTGKNPWGMTVAGFKANTTINRMDYNLKWNKTLEAGGLLVSEDVVVNLNMEMVKGK